MAKKKKKSMFKWSLVNTSGYPSSSKKARDYYRGSATEARTATGKIRWAGTTRSAKQRAASIANLKKARAARRKKKG